MKGFFGRVLLVDLSKKTHSVERISETVLGGYLGGKGLATQLLLEKNPPGVDPLSEENHLIFALGPVTDTPIAGSSRYGVFTKSPLTGFYSESYSGGKTAEPISRAGYDAIVLRGKSSSRVFLEISDTSVVFHDANHLWGKGTYETEDAVLEEVGEKGAKAVVIGPAGENLVRFALIENDYWRSAGRTGVGAVMGSKRVKAIVFHGGARREVADPDLVEDFRKKTLAKAKDNPGVAAYKNLGTPMMVALLTNVASFPTRYWAQGRYEHWQKISAEAGFWIPAMPSISATHLDFMGKNWQAFLDVFSVCRKEPQPTIGDMHPRGLEAWQALGEELNGAYGLAKDVEAACKDGAEAATKILQSS